VTDSALIVIDRLKSVPLEDRKKLLQQLALVMGGDANGDGIIDEGTRTGTASVVLRLCCVVLWFALYCIHPCSRGPLGFCSCFLFCLCLRPRFLGGPRPPPPPPLPPDY
jgi:hypothetical protein